LVVLLSFSQVTPLKKTYIESKTSKEIHGVHFGHPVDIHPQHLLGLCGELEKVFREQFCEKQRREPDQMTHDEKVSIRDMTEQMTAYMDAKIANGPIPVELGITVLVQAFIVYVNRWGKQGNMTEQWWKRWSLWTSTNVASLQIIYQKLHQAFL